MYCSQILLLHWKEFIFLFLLFLFSEDVVIIQSIQSTTTNARISTKLNFYVFFRWMKSEISLVIRLIRCISAALICSFLFFCLLFEELEQFCLLDYISHFSKTKLDRSTNYLLLLIDLLSMVSTLVVYGGLVVYKRIALQVRWFNYQYIEFYEYRMLLFYYLLRECLSLYHPILIILHCLWVTLESWTASSNYA